MCFFSQWFDTYIHRYQIYQNRCSAVFKYKFKDGGRRCFSYLVTNWDTDVVLSRSPASVQVGLSHDDGILFSDWVRLRALSHSMVTSQLDKAVQQQCRGLKLQLSFEELKVFFSRIVTLQTCLLPAMTRDRSAASQALHMMSGVKEQSPFLLP